MGKTGQDPSFIPNIVRWLLMRRSCAFDDDSLAILEPALLDAGDIARAKVFERVEIQQQAFPLSNAAFK
jgi:hypothetical protein